MMESIKLKEIPFENMNGDSLMVCRECEGSGVRGVAERSKTSKNKETASQDKEQKVITGKVLQMFKKNGWSTKMHTCELCKGAGVRVVK